jgi:hypothetical protein
VFFLASKLLKTIPQVSSVHYSSGLFLCPVPAALFHVSELRSLILLLHQAAATTCYVAVHPAVAGVSGKYFTDCNEASPSRLSASSEEAAKLWSFSESITAEKIPKMGVYVSTGGFRLQVQSSNAGRGMSFA